VNEFVAHPSVEVVRVDDAEFTASLDLYRERPDQSYSLTDCISMIVCKKLGITDVLTSDSDFTHEGLTPRKMSVMSYSGVRIASAMLISGHGRHRSLRTTARPHRHPAAIAAQR
jgi:hypothetical protein